MSAAAIPLYQLGDERQVLDQWLLETDGELTPEIEQLLDELTTQIDVKVERVALYVRERLVEAEAVKAEAQRLAARQKALDRSAESLKRYLQHQLERCGRDKVQGRLVTVALQKNPPSVKGELTQDQLAELYALGLTHLVKRIPESFALDRRGALDGWKTDGELPAGLTVEQGVSLRIR